MNTVGRGGVSFQLPKSTSPAAGRRHVLRRVVGFFVWQYPSPHGRSAAPEWHPSPHFCIAIATLIVIVASLAFAWFLSHQPADLSRPPRPFEEVVGPNVECGVPDVYDCMTFAEAGD